MWFRGVHLGVMAAFKTNKTNKQTKVAHWGWSGNTHQWETNPPHSRITLRRLDYALCSRNDICAYLSNKSSFATTVTKETTVLWIYFSNSANVIPLFIYLFIFCPRKTKQFSACFHPRVFIKAPLVGNGLADYSPSHLSACLH